MRVLEVDSLGWEAAIVTIEGEPILLVDGALDVDRRINLLTRVMAGQA